MNKKLLHSISSVIGVLLFAAALMIIHHTLRKYHYHEITRWLREIPIGFVILSCVLTLSSYLMLTFYDFLALRYIRHPLKYRQTMMASFVGYTFAHNVTIFGGSAARYRIYSALGLSAQEVAKLVIFCGLTFWLGLFIIGGAIFAFKPPQIPDSLHILFNSIHLIGFVFLGIVITYIIYGTFVKLPVKIRGWELDFPNLRIILVQVVISSLDWILAGGVLYALLPNRAGLNYTDFLGLFMFAQVAGLLSHVPGGLGVFETIILLLLSDYCEPSQVISSLILYRIIYYLLPLGIASVLLGTHELLKNRHIIKQVGTILGQWSSAVTPNILAFSTFVGGVILLFSGAIPGERNRLAWLYNLLPLPVIEISHFMGSVVGAALLILARGLQRRLDARIPLFRNSSRRGYCIFSFEGSELWRCAGFDHYARGAAAVSKRFLS